MIQFQDIKENEKNQKPNDTSSIDSFQSDDQQLKDQKRILNKSNKSTSLQKINQYLTFSITTLKQHHDSVNPKNHSNYEQTQLSKLQKKKDQFLNNEIESQSPQKSGTSLNQNTLRFLSSYQSHHRERLQKKILESGRFRKVDSFTSELLVYDMHPSKHYEIIKLGVQLLWYRTQILILNTLTKNPLPQMGCISGSGSSGTVYLIQTICDQIAIKSMQFVLKDKSNPDFTKLNSSFVIDCIREYFWLMIFSQLEIGPEVKNICGFDMILYEDSIQFATEVCKFVRTQEQPQIKKFKEQVSSALFDMHMLQVVHRDIKPFNIMFSPKFNKHVIIDFGCSKVIKQKLGEMTLSTFIGTTAFCSKQMLALLPKKQGFVDLYFNDLFGLQKTFNNESRKTLMQRNLVKKPQTSHYEQILMKFHLYQHDFNNILNVWTQVIDFYEDDDDELQEIQKSVLQFLSELKITSQIKHFYWKEITESIRDLPEFIQLNIWMINQHQIFTEISTSKVKEEKFSSFKFIYKTLQIKASNLNSKERKLDYILISQHSLVQYLQSCELKLQGKQKLSFIEDQNQCINFFLIIALYSSLGSNKYSSNVEKKINACQIGLKLFYQKYGSEKDKDIVFQTSFEIYSPIVKFYQHFIFHIWSKVPDRYKSVSIINSIITLHLLGYPSKTTNDTFFLFDSAIISAKDTFDFSKEEQRFLAIRIFWQCKLTSMILGEAFYNKNKLKIHKFKRTIQDEIQLQNMENNLFDSQNEGQMSKIFQVNSLIYQLLIIDFLNFNEIAFKKISSMLNTTEILQLSKKYCQIREWRSVMKLLLRSFGSINQIESSGSYVQKINDEILFQHKYKENIFPFALCLFFQDPLQQKNRYQIFNQIDNIINESQISIRISPQKRLISSLLRKDFKTIDSISNLLEKQTQNNQFDLSQHPNIYLILQDIILFTGIYIKDLPKLGNQSINLLGKCFQIVKYLIHIGYVYYQSGKQIQTIKSIPSSQITGQFIDKSFNQGNFMRNYFLFILNISQIYQKLCHVIKKYLSPSYSSIQISQSQGENYQRNLWVQLDNQHLRFLQTVSNNKNLFNFTKYWFEMISQHPQIKSIIKQNRNLTLALFHIYMKDRQTQTQLQKGQKIIQDFFDFNSPQVFQSDDHSQKLLPSFQIAFDYYQIKILKTNFGIKQCEQCIRLFEICIKKDSFHLVFEKNGILRFIFNCYLYTKRSFQQILELLIFFTKILQKSPNKDRVKLLAQNLYSFLCCKCQNCFSRPPQNWNNFQFVEYLYQTISQVKCSQNPYMGLVYYFAMMNHRQKAEVTQKFVKFIIRSMQYLTKDARNIIVTRLNFFIYRGFHLNERKRFHDLKGLEGLDRVRNFPLSEKNQKIHRRFLHNYIKTKKNQSETENSIQHHISIIMQKQNYYKNYKLPPAIKEIYTKKLRRYFEVKQNYQKSNQLQNILKFQHRPYSIFQ